MSDTLGSIIESPSQKPILKPSSFDIDSSPISFKHNSNIQNSLQTSFLDSTQHASFLPPSEPPSSKVRFNRANTATIQDTIRTRKRATSTAIKINRSVLEPSNLLDDSINFPTSQLNISFQENGRRDSITKTLFNLPPLMSHLSTPEPPPRGRSQTFTTKPLQPTITEQKEYKTKSVIPSPTRSKSNKDKDKTQEQKIPSLILNDIKKAGHSTQSRQNSLLRHICGSTDLLKKDRFVRFLEGSVKRIFKMAEPPKKLQKEKEDLKFKEIERLNKEMKLKKQGNKVDRDLRSESLDEVRELSKDDKEERRKDIMEFTFYKEVNDLIQFCAKENSIYIFLKAIKLLGTLYLNYEKIDEAFHCFCQMRWASEYLGIYKAKASAFFKMADCCKLLEYYDDAIKLLRKSLQYSWEHNLVNREMKIYDTLGKLYYLKGEIKKAQYYNERFASGISEPKDSPLREHYNQFLIDNREKGRYGNFTSLDIGFMTTRITLPLLPSNLNRRNSQFSVLSSFSAEEQRKNEIDQRPTNVKTFQDQVSAVVKDSELILHREAGVDGDDADDKQEGPEMVELPSPSFKVNLAELEPARNNEQKLRDLKLKEERLNGAIRNARRELTDQGSEGNRKKTMHNIFEMQIAFQREKRSILNEQQAYRIHLAKLWKSQYHVFESKRKPGICKTNIKTDARVVVENKYDIKLDDPDFFKGVTKKILALRFENKIPPFVLMTHKKMLPKPLKRDIALLNEKAKKIYLKFYKTIMKKIAPERVNKFSRDEAT